MNVSGTLVTGMFRAEAAATSTASAPTLPREMTLQLFRLSMMFLVMGRPLAMSASQSCADSINSSSVAAGISMISAPIVLSDSSSSSYDPPRHVEGHACWPLSHYFEVCQFPSPFETVAVLGRSNDTVAMTAFRIREGL